MTDELLGELAARMKFIADALPRHKLSALQALGLARECLRQMEWARHETVMQAEKAFDLHTQEAIGQWDRAAYGAGARTALSVIKRDARRNWGRGVMPAPVDWKIPEATE